MTTADATRLQAEISSERGELAKVHQQIMIRTSNLDDTTTYALALLLMNYYTGVERLFRRVALQLGGMPPGGERWHAQLLEDMALALPNIRPAVIQTRTRDWLGRLLRLRHVLRNLYAWSVRREELDVHIAELAAQHPTLVADLDAFEAFLAELTATET